MSSPRLRHSARAIVLDEEERILLCKLVLPGRVVWVAPGGGLESGESPRAALGRELREETGLVLAGTPPHVWRRRVVDPGYVPGYDGAIQDYFLVRTAYFIPRGTLSAAELAAENIAGFRWWRLAEISAYRGSDLFGPRDLAGPLARLLDGGIPDQPLDLPR